MPLDPSVVNASILNDLLCHIGATATSFWLARDAKGEEHQRHLSAQEFRPLAFVRRASGQAGCATIFPSERFELDVENQGNPLADYLKPLCGWRRTAGDERLP